MNRVHRSEHPVWKVRHDEDEPLPSDRRCPSKWGAADERGAANHMTPETVMRAARLVKEGKIYELGRVLEPAMSTG